MYHSVLSHLPTHSTKPCISLLLPSCMVFSCTLIEKILSVSIFLRTTGIKKNSYGSICGVVTSTATQLVTVLASGKHSPGCLEQIWSYTLCCFFQHSVILKIIILDNEAKPTTMSSKVHTETSAATSCRCDQPWKAKQLHALVTCKCYTLESQKGSTSLSLPQNQAGTGGYVIPSPNTEIKSTV